MLFVSYCYCHEFLIISFVRPFFTVETNSQRVSKLVYCLIYSFGNSVTIESRWKENGFKNILFMYFIYHCVFYSLQAFIQMVVWASCWRPLCIENYFIFHRLPYKLLFLACTIAHFGWLLFKFLAKSLILCYCNITTSVILFNNKILR